MRAVVFDGALRLDAAHAEPTLVPGEAVVKVHLAGICNTDIEITAAGIADEKVRPTLSPRNTLEAVKMTVITAPSSTPRNVSSGSVTSAGTRVG